MVILLLSYAFSEVIWLMAAKFSQSVFWISTIFGVEKRHFEKAFGLSKKKKNEIKCKKEKKSKMVENPICCPWVVQKEMLQSKDSLIYIYTKKVAYFSSSSSSSALSVLLSHRHSALLWSMMARHIVEQQKAYLAQDVKFL